MGVARIGRTRDLFSPYYEPAMNPYRDPSPPPGKKKLARVRARVRGFFRRIVGPGIAIVVMSVLAGSCQMLIHQDNKETVARYKGDVDNVLDAQKRSLAKVQEDNAKKSLELTEREEKLKARTENFENMLRLSKLISPSNGDVNDLLEKMGHLDRK